MDEQTQAEFIEWLTQKLEVESEDELQQQLNEMGDDGVRQAYEVFQKEKQTPMNQKGGKLSYLQKLQQGGAVKKSAPKEDWSKVYDGWGYKKGGQESQVAQRNRGVANTTSGYEYVNEPAQSSGSAQATTETGGSPLIGGAAPQTYGYGPYNQGRNTAGVGGAQRQMTQSEWDHVRTQSGMKDVYKMQGTTSGLTSESQWPLVDKLLTDYRAKQNQALPQMGQALPQGQLARAFAKGGSIKDKGQDGKTAVLGNNPKGMDSADAHGGRKDHGNPKLSALKKLKSKGKDHKTALLGNNPKGKDGKTGLGRRHDSGMSEHTALNKK